MIRFRMPVVLIILIVVLICAIVPVVVIKKDRNYFSYATIVLDAGHGGIDGGVVGKTGVKESDINLDIVLRLEKALKKSNFDVVLTRKDENAFSNIKIEDMKARKKIIIESDASAVISIHVNKCSSKLRRGVQVFYDDKLIGEHLANIMQNSMNLYINKLYCERANFEAKPGDFYITKCSKIPSIIIECGFMSNTSDEKLLLTDKYKDDIVDKIVKTLMSIFVLSKNGV